METKHLDVLARIGDRCPISGYLLKSYKGLTDLSPAVLGGPQDSRLEITCYSVEFLYRQDTSALPSPRLMVYRLSFLPFRAVLTGSLVTSTSLTF